MTFRQLAAEVMIAKGMTPEDVAWIAKMSTAAIPGANVEREVPPEDEAALRQHLSDLHDAALQHPLAAGVVLEKYMQKIRANN